MTEPWVLFENKSNKLKGQRNNLQDQLKFVNKKLTLIEKQYNEWQEQSNWSESFED